MLQSDIDPDHSVDDGQFRLALAIIDQQVGVPFARWHVFDRNPFYNASDLAVQSDRDVPDLGKVQ
jgi:hypothetical protein